jgi:hypothetical protein
MSFQVPQWLLLAGYTLLTTAIFYSRRPKMLLRSSIQTLPRETASLPAPPLFGGEQLVSQRPAV